MKITYPENWLETENYSQDKPVIYLFGWAGATEEDMDKYSCIYNQIGLITVTYLAPWTYITIYSLAKKKSLPNVKNF